MPGHQVPRRFSARQQRLSARQRHSSTPSSFISRPALVLLVALLLCVMLFVAACGSANTDGPSTTSTIAAAESTFPITVVDDNKTTVTIAEKPMRIVSTAPANTEMLFALGAGDRVVGVTSLDDYPPEAAAIAKVGDFQVNTEAVMALSPDLVVGYSGNEEALAPVQAAGAAVLILNPVNLEGIYSNIAAVGAAIGEPGMAAELVDSIKAQVKAVTEATAATGTSPKVFYALDKTLWTAGPGSFVDELLALVNATNVGSMTGAGSAATDAFYQFAPEQLIAADPDVILLPDTAYESVEEFTADPRFATLTAVRDGRVFLIDDAPVTRPGPRIGEGLRILAEAVHPEAF